MNTARLKSNLTLTDKVQLFVYAWAADKEAKGGAMPFCMDDEPVTPNDLSAPGMLLPVIGWHCARIYTSSGFGERMNVEFPQNPDALLKHNVRFERFARPDAELMLFLAEALEDAAQNLPKPNPARPTANLRLLTEQFQEAMREALPKKAPGRVVAA